jgi:hypothetical protein
LTESAKPAEVASARDVHGKPVAQVAAEPPEALQTNSQAEAPAATAPPAASPAAAASSPTASRTKSQGAESSATFEDDFEDLSRQPTTDQAGAVDPLEASEDPFERTGSAPTSLKGTAASKDLDDVFEESGTDTPAGGVKKKDADEFEASGASIQPDVKGCKTYGSDDFEKDDEDKEKTTAADAKPAKEVDAKEEVDAKADKSAKVQAFLGKAGPVGIGGVTSQTEADPKEVVVAGSMNADVESESEDAESDDGQVELAKDAKKASTQTNDSADDDYEEDFASEAPDPSEASKDTKDIEDFGSRRASPTSAAGKAASKEEPAKQETPSAKPSTEEKDADNEYDDAEFSEVSSKTKDTKEIPASESELSSNAKP